MTAEQAAEPSSSLHQRAHTFTNDRLRAPARHIDLPEIAQQRASNKCKIIQQTTAAAAASVKN
jgi:hypothetical protein